MTKLLLKLLLKRSKILVFKQKNPKQSLEHDLSDFVSHKTKYFFTSFKLSTDFFEVDPPEWKNNEDYRASEFCQNWFVFTNPAERGVKFLKDFNRILSRDENELQFILLVVDLIYRKKYPMGTTHRIQKLEAKVDYD